ncbi:uncharacterized protein PHACADRAFT_257472 [Phanerochaete carnosa HHB-10118-sp]|uniref:FAD-binding domain-containing protein n=1 Tax=Phanerochaete carnosa (strain HHB-10118-sp) TaxID=650164 RepID=K5VR63_PHACS|nr:uncharacterized protein PHACADRAFT_257472 [Phanerochaete carnosa HHB-10118-sp]EKM53958.1 hypothetical protein PHACADRAFT_257472 [Phanerochaete carnosa HHB-10118-sp]
MLLPSPRVAVIGGGITGPALAIFLKLKGYEPVIYERSQASCEAGLCLGLQPNGLRVLSKVPGLVEHIRGWPVDEYGFYSVLPEDMGVLAELDQPKQLRLSQGIGPVGIRRSDLQRRLFEFVESIGVKVQWGCKLEELEQTEDSVRLRFANGVEEEASFVVGCDGLHSNTRSCLFGDQPADFTGLTQCGGFSPIPEHLRGRSMTMSLYGDGVHLIAVQVDEDTMGWAVTQREPEAKEAWRAMDDVALAELKESQFSTWDFGGGELVRNGTHVTKYGLYDRPNLTTWYQGRVVLIGDAAHPTSPHLGQGANQAFEDVDLLIGLLEKYNPCAQSPSTPTLETVFTELETVRIPRTSKMVRLARAQGEIRVTQGVEACKARNDAYREKFMKKQLGRARLES